MLVYPDHKILLLRVRDPLTISSVIPKHKLVDIEGHNIAVRHGLEEVKVLRNMGVEAPSPILHHYAWPGKFVAMEHQKQTAAMLTLERRAFVLNETGTAKTASALWAADYLMTQGVVRKCLIASKLSTLEAVWMKEIFTVLMHRNAVVLHGDKAKRKARLAQDVDFYIINHEGLAVLRKDIAARKDIDLIICDEYAEYRNHTTSKFEVLDSLLKPSTRFWGMTATPCPNAPTDAYALTKLISPDNIPPYFGQFKRETMLQITQYKWVPRPQAYDIAFKAMQPAVRYRKADCLDLPPVVTEERTCELSPEQKRAFDRMRLDMVAEAKAGVQITAVNAADKIIKLRQILCISKETPILTQSGWKPICEITCFDIVWDGVEWVHHSGIINNGFRRVVECDGVRMTPDHKVLTVTGWHTAEEIIHGVSSDRFNRESVRLPDGFVTSWNDSRHFAEGVVAVCLRVRGRGCQGKPESANQEETQCETLRVSARRAYNNAQHVVHSTTPYLVKYEKALPKYIGQRLEKLRRAWDSGVLFVGRFVREFLGGYAARVRRALDTRSKGQQQRVRARKLQVGDLLGARKQHPSKQNARYSTRAHDTSTGRESLRPYDRLPLGEVERGVGVDSRSDKTEFSEVFDIVDCGPRNRFVVRGRDGELLIVHNCGAIRNPGAAAGLFHSGMTDEEMADAFAQQENEYVSIPHAPRLQVLLECIQEASAKVLVVVPFKGILRVLEEEVSQHYTCGVLNGDVTPANRNKIITAFKTTDSPHVLLCHPQVMAHGLNLTEADFCIFYAPIYSNDQAQQVVERFNRPGQTRKMTVIRIGAAATSLEWDIYRSVDTKQAGQNSILDLYKRVMS